jgi:hypothetical protein
MSSEALYWLNTQGGHIEPAGNQAIGEARLWRVLASLTAHADERTGEVWVSDRTQEQETGIPRRLIRQGRALLVEQGYLVATDKTRTKGVKVYRLELPGYSWRGVDNPSSGQGSGQASGQGSGEDCLPQTEQNRNTPLPPTNKTEPERDKRPGGKAREWGDRHAQVLAGCIERERTRTRGEVGPGLVRTWEREYRPIIEQALRDHPGANMETLVRQCVATRNGTPTATTPTAKVEGQAGCKTCHGTGYWQEPTGPYHYCPCTGRPDATHKDTPGRTQERVTAEEGTNTDSPAPGATADPRSDQVSDLPKRLRRVV